MKAIKLLSIVAISLMCRAVQAQINQSLVTPNPTTEAKCLYQFLKDNYGKKIISGTMTLSSFDETDWLKQNTGKEPALIGIDFLQTNRGYTWYNDNTPANDAITYYNKGGIPILCWHWRDPSRKTDYFYTQSAQPSAYTSFDITKINDASSAEYKAMISDIDFVAGQLKRIQDAKGAVLWRPLHEAAGGWFWWGKNGPACKKLYQVMYDRMVNYHGLKNLIWVWTKEANDDAFYPGDEYVDIVGRDYYYTGNHGSIVSEYNSISSHYGNKKITTISECGSFPDPDNLVKDGAKWSWFMTWYGDFVRSATYNSLDLWKKAFNHSYVITLDEMPNIKTCGTTNPIPTVSITAPANNSSVCVGTSITITATASISSGSVSKVDFYDGNTLLGTDNSSPYSYTWSNAAAGAHTVRAIATSALSVASNEATVSVTVNAATVIDPYIQVNGGTWAAQASATLCQGGSINIGPHPYDVATGWSWTGPSNFTSSVREISFANITTAQGGTYTVTFKDANNCTSNLAIPVTVNAKPTVTITSPANNSTVVASPITIGANVAGTSITNVQFYNGSALLGSDATSPYSYSWVNTVNGAYTLNVKATNANNCADTATIKMTVSLITGLDGNTLSTEVACFPNPFNQSFTIKAPNHFDYTIMDATGAELEKGSAQNTVSVGKEFALGVYLVKVNTENKSVLLRITKR